MAVGLSVRNADSGSDSASRRNPQYGTLTIDAVAPDAWDATIATFQDVSPEQTITFSRIRWPSLDYEPLLFRRGAETVGGALMMIQRLPLGVGSIAIAKWAPMLRDTGRSDAADVTRDMVEALVGHYARDRGMMLSMLPRPRADAARQEQPWLTERGFVEGTNVPFPNRYIVDLAIDDTAHRKSIGSKWRYHLAKSEKAGLEFDVADRSALPEFEALYTSMSDRKRFPDYSAYASVPAMMSIGDSRLRPQLFFVRHEGDIVAGAVIFRTGDTAIYLYGATNDRALPLRAGYFMHWQIVRWLKAHTETRWYDLGGNDGFNGLHQFKKGLVGSAGAIVPLPPMMHFAAGRLSYLLGTGAFLLRDIALNMRHRLNTARSGEARPDMQPAARS